MDLNIKILIKLIHFLKTDFNLFLNSKSYILKYSSLLDKK